MAMGNGPADEPITGINVTPLVDIMLVLLIIVMVTAKFVVPQIKVELPKAVTADTADIQTFSVVITKEREYYLNGKPIRKSDIGGYIDERLAAMNGNATADDPGSKDLQVVISADREVQHGEVVSVIDLVRRHGVKKFAINVDAVEETDAD